MKNFIYLLSAVVVLIFSLQTQAGTLPGMQVLNMQWSTSSGQFDDRIILREMRGVGIAQHFHNGAGEDQGKYTYDRINGVDRILVRLYGNALTLNAVDEDLDGCYELDVIHTSGILDSIQACVTPFNYADFVSYILSHR